MITNYILTNIDIIIFTSFLSLNLIVGLLHGKKIQNITEYALGDRKFSTMTLIATLVATRVSGSGFFTSLSKVYQNGFYFLISFFGIGLSTVLTGIYIVPRMTEFLGDLSIGDSMGKLYGKKVQIITAICGSIGSAGMIAVQFKAFSSIIDYSFGISGNTAIILAASIVMIYSIFGGIRSVAFTDVLQFFTFFLIFPIVVILIVKNIDFMSIDITSAFSHNKFDIFEVLNVGNPKFWEHFPIFLYFLVPGISSACYQRILIGSNITQIRKVFIMSGILIIVFMIIQAMLPVLVYSLNPNLEPEKILSYIIDKYSYTGLRGAMMICIVSLAMSTADSFLNASSVLLSNDLCKPLNIFVDKSVLILSRYFSFFIGCLAILLAIYGKDLLSIVLNANSFYMPIVTVPFLLAVFGFRSEEKPVLIGMSAGLVTVLSINILGLDIDKVIPGMIANALFFISSHYVTGAKGGWRKVVAVYPDNSFIKNQNSKIIKLIRSLTKFDYKNYCTNLKPENSSVYIRFGIYSILSIVLSAYILDKQIRIENYSIIEFVLQTGLLCSILNITYTIWPDKISEQIKSNIMQFLWPLSVLYTSIVIPTIFVFITNGGGIYTSLFVIGIFVALIVMNTKKAIVLSSLCFFATFKYCTYRFHHNLIDGMYSANINILHIYLFVVLIAVLFLIPQCKRYSNLKIVNQKYKQDLFSVKNDLIEAENFKTNILTNVDHEISIPFMVAWNSADFLDKNWDKIKEEGKKDLIKDMNTSLHGLSLYIEDVKDLMTLRINTRILDYKPVYLDEIVYSQIQLCKELYFNDEKIQFLDLYHELKSTLVECDEQLMTKVVHHLIKNAILYSSSGMIKITLGLDQDNNDMAKFEVKDEGIGLPEDEISKIFNPFVESKWTKSAAKGRGLGLAISSDIVMKHGGYISCKNNSAKIEINHNVQEHKGATFWFCVPVKATIQQTELRSNQEDVDKHVSTLKNISNYFNQNN